MSGRAIRGLAFGLLCAGALGLAAGAIATAIAADLRRPRDLHGAPYATSSECRSCHPSHYRSWARTFHRRMNQEATEESVLGAFDGRTLAYGGVEATLSREPESGDFVIDLIDPARGRLPRIRVARTVGSRRVQQYLAREGDRYLRLPIAWNVEEGRFMHMNGAFLTPDPPGFEEGAVGPEDYRRHVTRWNDNCIFCHNVAPNPGRHGEADPPRFESEVAELGIACEACHGPAEEHAARNRNPGRRYALHLGAGPDPTIVNPARLDHERGSEVCGRCHGQRITRHIERFLEEGDPFVPGDALDRYSRPLARETSLRGAKGSFEARFWPDGTARLTAYEYQGLLRSPCYERGELRCTSCHGMHEGDPRGQIRPDRLGDQACTSCHAELAAPAAVVAHSRHEAGSSGASCLGCHMPRTVYGVVTAHRSHAIEVPDPARDMAARRPDACTLCHVDRSRDWAIEAFEARFGVRGERADASRIPEMERMIFGGDPIERALAADALGQPAAAGTRARRLGLLLEAMEGDAYPAVRRIAWRSLGRLIGRTPDDPLLLRFDPAAPRATRRRAIDALRQNLPIEALPPGRERLDRLRAQAGQEAIFIGE